jgi:phosphatidylserine/phosphatidylglycerophosphate/cardiolipin synthase-like enzyme
VSLRQASVLLAAALLSACSLSPKKIADVDARVDASRGTGLTCPRNAPDRCAAPSPVLDLGRIARREGLHRVKLIEFGPEALELRVHMIRAARHRIDLQNFILRRDDSGELILNELLKAARRGVKVRLLLDQMFSFSDAEHLVSLTMAHSNLEVRFYNPSFHKAEMAKHDWVSAVACCFRRFNQRMHNKLLADIADRYFDFDTNYEFKDRDVAVYGPAVTESGGLRARRHGDAAVLRLVLGQPEDRARAAPARRRRGASGSRSCRAGRLCPAAPLRSVAGAAGGRALPRGGFCR